MPSGIIRLGFLALNVVDAFPILFLPHWMRTNTDDHNYAVDHGGGIKNGNSSVRL